MAWHGLWISSLGTPGVIPRSTVSSSPHFASMTPASSGTLFGTALALSLSCSLTPSQVSKRKAVAELLGDGATHGPFNVATSSTPSTSSSTSSNSAPELAELVLEALATTCVRLQKEAGGVTEGPQASRRAMLRWTLILCLWPVVVVPCGFPSLSSSSSSSSKAQSVVVGVRLCRKSLLSTSSCNRGTSHQSHCCHPLECQSQ